MSTADRECPRRFDVLRLGQPRSRRWRKAPRRARQSLRQSLRTKFKADSAGDVRGRARGHAELVHHLLGDFAEGAELGVYEDVGLAIELFSFGEELADFA